MDRSSGCCGVYSLVEVYSTLTRMPGKQRVGSDKALLFVDELRQRFSLIALTIDEYVEMLSASAARGIVGGGIYDALLAQCAIKSGAETIYTWNMRNFARCGPEMVQRLRTP